MIDDSFREFIMYIEYEKGYSNKTVISYERDLNCFISFLHDNGIKNINSVDYHLLRKYLNIFYDKNYSSRTICRHISSIRSFFKYLLKNDIVKSDPTLLISNPKVERRLPNYLNYNDLENIINGMGEYDSVSVRDKLLFELLYSTGIRVFELVSIKLDDINMDSGMILIHGKGSKDRYVLFGKNCSNLLDLYINKYRCIFIKYECDYLFVNSRGNRMGVRMVQEIIKGIRSKFNINFKLTPHTLRHTFATHMLDNGADLLTVKELLGHENLQTTSIYTHVSNDKLRRVYMDSHPRNRR